MIKNPKLLKQWAISNDSVWNIGYIDHSLYQNNHDSMLHHTHRHTQTFCYNIRHRFTLTNSNSTQINHSTWNFKCNLRKVMWYCLNIRLRYSCIYIFRLWLCVCVCFVCRVQLICSDSLEKPPMVLKWKRKNSFLFTSYQMFTENGSSHLKLRISTLISNFHPLNVSKLIINP